MPAAVDPTKPDNIEAAPESCRSRGDALR